MKIHIFWALWILRFHLARTHQLFFSLKIKTDYRTCLWSDVVENTQTWLEVYMPGQVQSKVKPDPRSPLLLICNFPWSKCDLKQYRICFLWFSRMKMHAYVSIVCWVWLDKIFDYPCHAITFLFIPLLSRKEMQ